VIIVGPVLGPLFALLGACFGFIAGMFAYLLYLVSGGKIGNRRIASMGNPLKVMTSPAMMTVMSVIGVFAGWLVTGIVTGVWSFTKQMEDLSALVFRTPDLGPLKAIVGALIGLTVGRVVAARALAAPAAAAVDGKPAEGATGGCCCTGCGLSRLLVRPATIAAFAYVGLYVATAWHTGNWNPASQPRDIAAWFSEPPQGSVEVRAVDAWPTYRGGVERTGSLDNHPGPVAGKVLWVYKAGLTQLLGAPAVVGDYVFTGATDGSLLVLKAAPAAEPRLQIARREKFPNAIFSAPAIVDGLAVFGEGLHEDVKTRLRCLDLNDPKARVLWELEVPSHVESGPAIVGGRVIVGAGDEGVICVDLNRVAVGADVVDARSVKPSTDEFAELPTPVVHWRNKVSDPAKGVRMHVDTAPAVVGDRVFVGSGQFQEHGKTVGDRAVLCLSAADGALRWRTPTDFNPWGSPAVMGDKVIVGCSSVRMDPSTFGGAKGEVVCLDAASGRVLWKHVADGGVLSSAAIAGGTIVFATTAGTVEALDADGNPLWRSRSEAGYIAGPAVSGKFVYVADADATVRALGLADGAVQWTLRLDAHPQTPSPGAVYGSPAAAGGRLFLGTYGGYFVALGEQ
jgi:outer membrane protein assembly factor BamB